MIRVAAVDCGTNTLRLLIADLEVEVGRSRQLQRRTTIVRLGQDVDKTGAFADEALARAFTTLDEYALLIHASQPDRVKVVATSAARDVANRQAFIDGVVARIGVEPDIVTGDAEAVLAYHGAARELEERADLARPIVVVDIGGGSTELATRSAAGDPVHGLSLDIGSVRLTERHLHDDPPTEHQVDAAAADVEAALDGAAGLLDRVGTLVGVAGTVCTLAAMVLGLDVYDRDKVHRARLPTRELIDAIDSIVAMPVADRRRLGVMDPGRADVIAGGALVLAAVVRRSRVASMTASEHDILDGIAWSLT